MDYYIGMIGVFGFNWAPVGFATCQGQQIAISQNTALYSLLGVTFGGNGTTVFNLPNAQGRMMIGQGTNPQTGQNYTMGQTAGQEYVTLNSTQLPSHIHTASAAVQSSSSLGTKAAAGAGDYLGVVANGREAYTAYVPANAPGTTVALGGATVTVAPSGGNQPFSTMSPYLVMNPCISLDGLYPSRP